MVFFVFFLKKGRKILLLNLLLFVKFKLTNLKMENFTSNINKPDLHNYNTDDFNFMEDEYVSDFSSVDNNNEGLDDIIFEEDIFEDSNIGLNSEEYSDTSNFF